MALGFNAAAQGTVPGQSTQRDRWEAKPASSSSSYEAARSLPGTAGTSEGPFHFKQATRRGPAYEPPPQANDKAAVMGLQRPWQNGRPPVDCAVTPRDSACH